MAGIFGDEINSRGDFFVQLSTARLETIRLIAQMPNEPVLESVLRQLDAVSLWTANSRDPTLSERKSLNMGLVMYREFESTDDIELFHLRELIGSLNNYVLFWPNDSIASDPDNNNYLSIVALR